MNGYDVKIVIVHREWLSIKRKMDEIWETVLMISDIYLDECQAGFSQRLDKHLKWMQILLQTIEVGFKESKSGLIMNLIYFESIYITMCISSAIDKLELVTIYNQLKRI